MKHKWMIIFRGNVYKEHRQGNGATLISNDGVFYTDYDKAVTDAKTLIRQTNNEDCRVAHIAKVTIEVALTERRIGWVYDADHTGAWDLV